MYYLCCCHLRYCWIGLTQSVCMLISIPPFPDAGELFVWGYGTAIGFRHKDIITPTNKLSHYTNIVQLAAGATHSLGLTGEQCDWLTYHGSPSLFFYILTSVRAMLNMLLTLTPVCTPLTTLLCFPPERLTINQSTYWLAELACWSIGFLFGSLTDSMAVSLDDWLAQKLTRWLAWWMTDSMTDSLTDRLSDWNPGWSVQGIDHYNVSDLVVNCC